MQTITVEELKVKIDAGELLHLVDVREPHENAEFNFICLHGLYFAQWQ